jgi:ribosome-associated protein
MRGRGRRPAGKAEVDSKTSALRALAAVAEKRAVDPVLLDMREITPITDYFLICSGTSSVHIRALGDAVEEALAALGRKPYGSEGRGEGRWVLLDYGDVIVHIFAEEEREFYALERLWGDALRVAEATGAG